MKAAFWLLLAVVGYTYAGYPLWLYLRSRFRPRLVQAASIEPSVSVVLAARNEQDSIGGKLRNLRELNYPVDRYEIIVVSDGSTDATNGILAAKTGDRLRVFLLPQHLGKAAALNRGIVSAQGEIVVFTDARQPLEKDAIHYLAANFADDSVGCVTGELVLTRTEAEAGAQGLSLYWRLEKKIREWEGASGSVVGATGALYAVRKGLLVPLPEGTLLDDVYLPLQVARQGKRVVFEPRAQIFDSLASPHREFRRKVRTLMGNYQLVQLAPWLLSRANPLRFEFVCHKLLRLLVPFALSGLLVSSLFASGRIYEFAFVLQVVFYALAGLAIFRPHLGIVSRLADVALSFLVLNTAAAVAFVYFVARKKQVWVR